MAYQDLVIADGASNYWRLNETAGLTAVDAIGGKNGTISGGVTLNQPGVGGRTAMVFNGTTGQIVTAANVALLTPYTMEVWFKASSAVDVPLLSTRAGYPTRDVFQIKLQTGNGFATLVMDYANATSPEQGIAYGLNAANGQFHHFVAVVTPLNVYLYLDGAARAPYPLPATFTGVSFPVTIGRDQFDGFGASTLQDIALYPHALTPAQILAHYRASFSPYQLKVMDDGASAYWPLDDASGTTAREVVGGKHGTISGGVTLNQSGVDGTTAMVFNGTTGKIVTAANVTVPLVVTIEAWIKTTGASYHTIWSTRNPEVAQTFVFLTETAALSIYGTPTIAAVVSCPVNNGAWHHVVSIFDGSTVQFYMDGLALTAPQAAVRAASTGRVVSIGGEGAGNYFPGAMQDIAMYPRALTPAEITAHYKSRVTLSQYQSRVLADGASAYWPLDEVAGTVARDLTAGAKHGTISGGVTLNQPGAGGGKCMTFNGTTGKIITAATVAIVPAVTFEWWQSTTSLADLTYWGMPLAGSNDRVLVGTPNAGTVALNIYHASIGQVSTPQSSGLPNIRDGQWHHVVIVFPGDLTIRLYMDGVSGTVTGLPLQQPLVNQATVFQIGHHSDFVRWWLGSLQDIAIYPRALTPAEIATHYQTRLVPPVTSTDLTTAFAGYLKTLRAANPGKDLTTLVMKDLPNVRAAAPDELDDINTMYDDYLGGD